VENVKNKKNPIFVTFLITKREGKKWIRKGPQNGQKSSGHPRGYSHAWELVKNF
jgi:hypothetical protein